MAVFSDTNDLVAERYEHFFDFAYGDVRDTYGVGYVTNHPELVMLGVIAMAIMRSAERSKRRS